MTDNSMALKLERSGLYRRVLARNRALWGRMNISGKFGVAFGLLLILILITSITGYISLRAVSRAEHLIQKSSEIQRMVLKMDRGMERARRLHGSFFLEYPVIGFRNAHRKYVEPSISEITEVINVSSDLRSRLADFDSDSSGSEKIGSKIERSRIDLNLYLSSAKRFADISLQAVNMVTKLAMPQDGLEAQIDDCFDLFIQSLGNLPSYIKEHAEDINRSSLRYRMSRKRFYMQSAFNSAYTLRRELVSDLSVSSFQREKLLYILQKWSSIAEDILTVDVAIKSKFNDLSIQADAVGPVSQTLIALAENEVSKAREGIDRAYSTAIRVISVVSFTGILFAVIIFRILNMSITERITSLTEAAKKFRQSSLNNPIDDMAEIHPERYEYAYDGISSDELGELARTFDMMVMKMNNLVNSLKKKVELRTSELEASQKKLHRAEKMEAVGVLAGGVAHDLNNILSAIIGYPEMILMTLPRGSELEKPVRAIMESGQRAAAVVADLLTLARGAASTRSVESINNLIQQYTDSPEYKRLMELHFGIEFKIICDPGLCSISCSGIHIKKTVMNLVTNAAEAVHGKGTVRISTRNALLDEQDAARRGVKAGMYAVLEVSDTGDGICIKDVKHIFEPFYTRKVMGKSGTGLGLTVVWNTVQDHNGCIKVTTDNSGERVALYSSSDGAVMLEKLPPFDASTGFYGDGRIGIGRSSDRAGGTSFELYFPASEAGDEVEKGEDGEDVAENQSPYSSSGEGKKILIVDDEPYQIDLAKRMLTLFGYEAEGVNSGEKAIEYLKSHRVDLVLLDMIMAPGINGRETYERISIINPSQKAIIVSGFSESEDVRRARQMGVKSYLKKPYSVKQLSEAVAGALSE